MDYIHVCFVILLFALLGNGTMVPSHDNRHKRSLTEPVPSSGKQRLLVLTVEYPSKKGKYTAAQWQSDYFSLWNQFYQAQSYKKLQYEIDVVTVDSTGKPVINDPTSTSYIPLQNELTRYANGGYGWDFSSSWNLHTVVKHASSYLDAKNFDWSPYIQNGKVQNVMIMSAGTDYRYAEGTTDAKSNYLLSTSYSGVQYATKKGALLNSYTFCSEHTQSVGTSPLVMAKIGQCAHEFGHALGIPDLYDISGQSTGVGYFDLLGYGVYANGNQDGSTPVGYGAFSKSALGWATPTIITTEGQVNLGASSLAPGNFLKVFPDGQSNSSFYYLVENRQAIDTWDKNFVSQYTSGILIWSVNETSVTQFSLMNHINTYLSTALDITNCPPTPAVVVQEADGVQDMSTKSPIMRYGSSKDMYQVGDQFVGINNLAIAVLGLKEKEYTIYISYLGPVDIPDNLKDSAGSTLYASPLLFVILAAIGLVLV